MTEDSERRVEITRLEKGAYEAVNSRGGRLRFAAAGPGATGEEFTPVELFLAGIAGCGAIDVDFITAKRSEPESFSVSITGDKVRDASGNRIENLRLVFDIGFPDDDGGAAAREVLPDAVRRSHDRLCTVSRTVELGTAVEVEVR